MWYVLFIFLRFSGKHTFQMILLDFYNHLLVKDSHSYVINEKHVAFNGRFFITRLVLLRVFSDFSTINIFLLLFCFLFQLVIISRYPTA